MRLSYLNGLRALEATLRNGTFSAAAQEMGVTVAAVGQQIRGLEEYLNVKLFDRLPSGVRPTDAARSVAARLTSGFVQIEDVLSELREGSGKNRLKITLSHFMLDDWLAERIPKFHQQYPEIEISYETGEHYVDLLNSDVDMAIRFSPPPGPEYERIDLYRTVFMPICTPEFAQKHRLGPDTKDLTGVPLFQYHDATKDPAWINWSEVIRRRGRIRNDPGPTQKVSGYRTALSGEGLLLCGLTESFDDLREGRLVAPMGPAFVHEMSNFYRLIWPAGRSMTRPMKLFRDWLTTEVTGYLKVASEMLGVEIR